MALLIIAQDIKIASWVKHLNLLEPGLEIRIWPEAGDADEIEFALCWNPPPGELTKYKNLKCIASLGAGVDHLTCDPDLPAAVPITRVVDYSMAQSMSEYLVLSVLNYCRNFDAYRSAQHRRHWQRLRPLLAEDTHIGIMGLGQLGGDAANKLSSLGFKVSGWSRTPKNIDGVQCFSAENGWEDFLSRSQILICLLPLTPSTKGILNRKTFNQLPKDAYVINVARGQHLVENDLIEALDSGQLAGACLDVFVIEPLAADHPFWRHPKIKVTPHISSMTSPKAVAPQIIENYRRTKTGRPLLNVVDLKRGY
jgi:glyoxylate/hydroxypyruvate reductase A